MPGHGGIIWTDIWWVQYCMPGHGGIMGVQHCSLSTDEWSSILHSLLMGGPVLFTLLMGIQYCSLSTDEGSGTVHYLQMGVSNVHCLLMGGLVLFTGY